MTNSNRKIFFILLFAITGIIFISKLFYIQVIDDKYKVSAKNNALRYIYKYPARGLIYDRFGKLMVYNCASFDLVVVPIEIKNLDTLKFCNVVGITKDEFDKRMKKIINLSGYHQVSVFESDLSDYVYSQFQESSSSYRGFYIQNRTKRTYTLPIAPHTFGYIGEASPSIIEKDDYYRPGDYIGISGIEKFYEKELRGEKGLNVRVVDVHNSIQGSYKNGELDKKPIPGKDLFSSLDMELQNYAESLMVNKRGGIVAIEPASGEVLAMVSEPSYDPALLVGRERSKHYLELQNDEQNHPLYNRAIMTRYPPGSTFKVVNGLAALQEGILDENTMFSCYGGYRISDSHTIDCHAHWSPLAIRPAIAHSCNSWFCWAFKRFVDNNKFAAPREGYEKWREYVMNLGFGRQLGIDLPNEFGGNVPEAEYYDKLKGSRKWYANSIVSVAIGQGEIGATPLQLANLTAIIANRGYYIVPHVIKAVGNKKNVNKNFKTKYQTGIDKKYFEIIVDGMEMAVTSGTARVAQIDGIKVCAKTGTAQDPPRKNHSVFIAFAPKDEPKIAVAVLVENSGFGATYAAPIASLMIEYYINREVKRKDMEYSIRNTVLLNRNQ